MTHFCVLCPQKIQLLQRVTGRIVTSKQMACVTCNQQYNSVWHDISKRATPLLLLLLVVKPIAKCYFQLMCEMDSFSQENNIFALNATTMVFTTHIKYPVSQWQISHSSRRLLSAKCCRIDLDRRFSLSWHDPVHVVTFHAKSFIPSLF